tara:strand:+ start:3173 stop:3517 length:345 start_codon:yes stop_codon:yes gene_type:complete
MFHDVLHLLRQRVQRPRRRVREIPFHATVLTPRRVDVMDSKPFNEIARRTGADEERLEARAMVQSDVVVGEERTRSRITLYGDGERAVPRGDDVDVTVDVERVEGDDFETSVDV